MDLVVLIFRVTGKRMCEMTVTEVDSPTDTAIPTIPTTVSVSNPETETLEDSLIQPAGKPKIQ